MAMFVVKKAHRDRVLISMKQLYLFAAALMLSLPLSAAPDIHAFTSDGRQVLLKDNNTWSYVESGQGDPSKSAVLTVTEVVEMGDACKFQFRMQNNLGYRISTLVPRLAVKNLDGIIYETKSVSFTSIRPTKAEYTEVQFTGIGCHEMQQVTVFDASRCRMGDIDQWNEEQGQCLSHIYVEPSQLINITK
jgi:hypothetical protein